MAVALDQGEWDYAPPVLCTPNGFIDTLGTVIDANYLIVEGHSRRRYLNALIEQWRKHYNTKRPHSALGYRPPAPEVIVPMEPRPFMH